MGRLQCDTLRRKSEMLELLKQAIRADLSMTTLNMQTAYLSPRGREMDDCLLEEYRQGVLDAYAVVMEATAALVCERGVGKSA